MSCLSGLTLGSEVPSDREGVLGSQTFESGGHALAWGGQDKVRVGGTDLGWRWGAGLRKPMSVLGHLRVGLPSCCPGGGATSGVLGELTQDNPGTRAGRSRIPHKSGLQLLRQSWVPGRTTQIPRLQRRKLRSPRQWRADPAPDRMGTTCALARFPFTSLGEMAGAYTHPALGLVLLLQCSVREAGGVRGPGSGLCFALTAVCSPAGGAALGPIRRSRGPPTTTTVPTSLLLTGGWIRWGKGLLVFVGDPRLDELLYSHPWAEGSPKTVSGGGPRPGRPLPFPSRAAPSSREALRAPPPPCGKLGKLGKAALDILPRKGGEGRRGREKGKGKRKDRTQGRKERNITL